MKEDRAMQAAFALNEVGFALTALLIGWQRLSDAKRRDIIATAIKENINPALVNLSQDPTSAEGIQAFQPFPEV